MTDAKHWIYGNPVRVSMSGGRYAFRVDLGNGLTKREYFAAMAMQGLAANGFMSPTEMTWRAVHCADALINALNGVKDIEK